MHYAAKSWNELLSANTNKLKSSNSLCRGAKPKHFEADSATGSWTRTTEDQLGDSQQTHSDHGDPVLRYSSVTRRLKRVLFSLLGMRVGMTV